MLLYNINHFHNSTQNGVLVLFLIVIRTALPSGGLSPVTDYATLTYRYFFLRETKQVTHFYPSASFTSFVHFLLMSNRNLR